jgi:hypothetical protein
MLDKEFKYFVDHQDELVKKYEGRFIVIVDESVVGAYSSDAEAYVEATKTRKPGTFLIQHCIPGATAYRQSFHSRAVFT